MFCEYKNVVNDKLSEIIREIEFYKKDGISLVDFEFSLNTRYRACKEQYGENYWETCVYEGLLNSKDFLEKYL